MCSSNKQVASSLDGMKCNPGSDLTPPGFRKLHPGYKMKNHKRKQGCYYSNPTVNAVTRTYRRILSMPESARSNAPSARTVLTLF